MTKKHEPRLSRDDIAKIERISSRPMVSQMTPLSEADAIWENLIAEAQKPAVDEKETPPDRRQVMLGRKEFDDLLAALRRKADV